MLIPKKCPNFIRTKIKVCNYFYFYVTLSSTKKINNQPWRKRRVVYIKHTMIVKPKIKYALVFRCSYLKGTNFSSGRENKT